MKLHQQRCDCNLPDDNSENSQGYMWMNQCLKKSTLHDKSIVDEDGENTPPLNEAFRGVPSSNDNTRIIKPVHYLTDEFKEKVLRMDSNQLVKCY
uniref:Uncharacterized protein n=1 Tax=Strongyloides venezuelensis TaxID=75913 RepID=A0A0K0FVN0_STRVS